MNAKPLQYGRVIVPPPGNPQAETAITMLGMLPLGVLAVEAIVGFILLLISVVFFATIFFAFVGLFLLYIALWLAVLFNGFGVFVSLLTLLVGRRYTTGKVFGFSGLLIHVVLLGASVYSLATIHSYLSHSQDDRLRQPATYSEPRPDEAWPPIQVEKMTPDASDESIIGEESNDIE